MDRYLLGSCIFLSILCSCVSPVKELYPPRKDQPHILVYAVNHGWHTGVIINRAQARPYLPALGSDFLYAEYIEIGWGEEGFYQADEITVGLVLKAVFWPTDSVLHIVAIKGNPKEYFIRSELIEISLSEKGFERLVEAINDTFFLDEQGNSRPLKKGIYGDSRFYQANGSYHAFNTCNIWTARVFRASGFPISPFYASTAGNVMYQLKSYRLAGHAVE